MPAPYTRAVKAQLEIVQNKAGIPRMGLMRAAKQHAKKIWPNSHIGQGIWIQVLKDLINDGSLVQVGGQYEVSSTGTDTLAVANRYC